MQKSTEGTLTSAGENVVLINDFSSGYFDISYINITNIDSSENFIGVIKKTSISQSSLTSDNIGLKNKECIEYTSDSGFRTLDPSGAFKTATELPIGVIPERATQLEVNEGLNDDKYVTPLTFNNSDKWAEGISMITSVLNGTQVNSTIVPITISGQVFTLPPGKKCTVKGIFIFTAAAITTGAFYGFVITQSPGADGNAQGSWYGQVNLSSIASATGISDGDAINVIGGVSLASGILGTATTAGNNSAYIDMTIANTSTNVNTTIELQFRSEVAVSEVVARIGTSMNVIIN